jgi:hypothetical protein
LDCKHAANTGPVPSHYSPDTVRIKSKRCAIVRSARRSPPRREAGTLVCQHVGLADAVASSGRLSPISRDPAGKFQILFKLIVSPAGRCPRDGSANSHIALTKSPMRKLILIIPAALTPANISGPTGR